MVQVIPAIIPKSFDDLQEKAERVAPFVPLIQVDVMDGKFAPSTSWPYSDVHKEQFQELVAQKQTLAGGLHFEVDMMLKNPENHIDDWISVGAQSLIIHIGSTSKLGDVIESIREKGVGVGLALRPETPNRELDPWISKIDFVQFMGNQKIGYHGVGLDENVLGKIKDLRKQHTKLIIGIDIGVNFETAQQLVAAGINKLVSGSTIFNSTDIEGTIKKLSQL